MNFSRRQIARNSRSNLTRMLGVLTCFAITGVAKESAAQGLAPRISTVTVDPFRTLEDQLVNRLRATSRDQRGYLQFVVNQVRENRLDMRLVIAIQRYALRRRADFPFPFFEQALRVEAAKRNVILPRVQTFATTRIVTSS